MYCKTGDSGKTCEWHSDQWCQDLMHSNRHYDQPWYTATGGKSRADCQPLDIHDPWHPLGVGWASELVIPSSVHRCSILVTVQCRAEIDFIPPIHIFKWGLICLQTKDSQIIFKKNLSWNHRIWIYSTLLNFKGDSFYLC